jgi:hypothetical protein
MLADGAVKLAVVGVYSVEDGSILPKPERIVL